MWGYLCEDNRCQKTMLTDVNFHTTTGLSRCRLYCDGKKTGTLWPLPTGRIEVSNDVFELDINEVTFKTSNFRNEPELWEMVEKRFHEMQQRKRPRTYAMYDGGISLVIEVIAASDDMSE